VTDAHNWGARDDETSALYPCDTLGIAADDVFFRAISIAAPRELVFRWLCQLRVAPYSYDWLDNFGRPSPRRLIPRLQQLAVGQRIMTIFRLVSFEPGEHLTIALKSRAGALTMGNFAGTYRVAESSEGTRLVAKILVRYPTGPYGRLLRRYMPGLDLFMFKRQLKNLKRFAERDAAQGPSETRLGPYMG